MPRGIPKNKSNQEQKPATVTASQSHAAKDSDVFISPNSHGEAVRFDSENYGVVTVDLKNAKPAPKVEQKLEPLAPGQAYFEAPDGTVIIGDDTKNEIWCRTLNEGKGGWINKRR